MPEFSFVRLIGRSSTPNHVTITATDVETARERAIIALGTENIRQHIKIGQVFTSSVPVQPVQPAEKPTEPTDSRALLKPLTS